MLLHNQFKIDRKVYQNAEVHKSTFRFMHAPLCDNILYVIIVIVHSISGCFLYDGTAAGCISVRLFAIRNSSSNVLLFDQDQNVFIV